MARKETVRNAEELVERAMRGNDASHDATHVWRVRELALSLAREEGLFSNPDSMEIVNSSFFFFLLSCIVCLVAKKLEQKGRNGRKIETLCFSFNWVLNYVFGTLIWLN